MYARKFIMEVEDLIIDSKIRYNFLNTYHITFINLINNCIISIVESSYYLNYTSIQRDILIHGPVEATFIVHSL